MSMIVQKTKTIYHIESGDSRVQLTIDHINKKCEVFRLRLEQHSKLDKHALEFGENLLKINT